MKTQDEEVLRRSALFQFLPAEHFETLRPLLHEQEYEFGDIIVRQGDPVDAVYLLITGRARALRVYPNGEEIPLGSLKPGESRELSPEELEAAFPTRTLC